jgi:hypothetical protein
VTEISIVILTKDPINHSNPNASHDFVNVYDPNDNNPNTTKDSFNVSLGLRVIMVLSFIRVVFMLIVRLLQPHTKMTLMKSMVRMLPII